MTCFNILFHQTYSIHTRKNVRQFNDYNIDIDIILIAMVTLEIISMTIAYHAKSLAIYTHKTKMHTPKLPKYEEIKILIVSKNHNSFSNNIKKSLRLHGLNRVNYGQLLCKTYSTNQNKI